MINKVFLYKLGLGSESSLLRKEMPLSVYTGTDLFEQEVQCERGTGKDR